MTTPDDLFVRLSELGIPFETNCHPALFTVEQAKVLRGEIAGCHTKNLFLRDKKETMWLVVCREDRAVDLQWLAGEIGAKRLSFGSAARLERYLGVIPGAVTPFAVINDRNRDVNVVFDRAIVAEGPWNFHPLDNTMTTSIAPEDMLRFLEAEGHTPTYVDFDSRGSDDD